MSSVKVNIPFQVTVPFRLHANESIFVVGDNLELGNWKPQSGAKLNRISLTDDKEIWSKEIAVTVNQDTVNYRFFIGTVRVSNDEDQYTHQVFISSWETSLRPRQHHIFNKKLNEGEEIIYGRINNHSRWMRGWLTHQTELQLRIYGNALQWYKQQHRNMRIFLLCRYYTLHTNIFSYAGGSTGDDEECSHDDTDSVEISIARASKLTIDGSEFPWPKTPPHTLPVMGVEFVAGDFLTFHVQTVDLENLAVEIEIWGCNDAGPPMEGNGFLNKDSNCSLSSAAHNSVMNRQATENAHFQQLATGKILNFDGTKAVKSVHVFGKNRMPIGCLKIEYFVVRPLPGKEMDMEKTFALHWRNRHKILDVGHRGLGISKGTVATRVEATRENTIRSFKSAAEHGADYIEFDVHLSKDRIPIVYHDFKVVTVLRRKNKGDLQYMEIPVKDLTLSDLQSLKLEDHHVLKMDHTIDVLEKADDDPIDNQPFPTLQQCFETIDDLVGYNIELKYPQDMKAGESEQEHYFEQNDFVDRILNVVFTYAQNRSIIFSCFDPDICIMLSLKQNKYPVLYLTQGQSKRYPEYKDVRTRSTLMAIRFVKSIGILGLCASAEELLQDLSLLDEIRRQKLILFVWGEELVDAKNQETIRNGGCHGLIYDRIHERLTAGTLNVFKICRELTDAGAAVDDDESMF